MDITLYFRVRVNGEDGSLLPGTYGVSMEMDGFKEGVTYQEVAEAVNKEKMVEAIGLAGIVSPENFDVITPEEFAAEFPDFGKDEVEINA